MIRLGTLTVCVLVAIGLTGCVGTPPTDGPETNPPSEGIPERTESPPNELESTLVELTNATDRATFAQDHNLVYENGSVEVVIRVADGATLPDMDAIDIKIRSGPQVQAFVKVDSLDTVASHSNVSAVRTPARPRHG